MKNIGSKDYGEVLWPVADSHVLSRHANDIYENLYRPIVRQRGDKRQVDKQIFNRRINQLKKESHGHILIATRQGWYSFRENIVRGYVRLRAEREGIAIGIDHSRFGRD